MERCREEDLCILKLETVESFEYMAKADRNKDEGMFNCLGKKPIRDF